tara:strand:- start:93 stop:683 length:591 start_codon:yes stop_codon:yes gene_type:complete
MVSKKIVIIFFIIIFLGIFFLFFYLKLEKKNKVSLPIAEETIEIVPKSNIIKDINYSTKDADGNEYIITALQGEIDYSNTDIIFLTKVKAFINLANSENITITSDYGKYNSNNFDTIFSKNVIINYLENGITGEYLDFSMIRNSMIISKNVVYTNVENILRADVVEINIKTKDTKIFMYEANKKVNIKSKDQNGDN